jgi:hypothetical protein
VAVRYYLDTEFNGFGGELMSLALVPADTSLPHFYCVVECHSTIDPWVRKHVVPFLNEEPVSISRASAWLAAYLRTATYPVIVADWPADFEHLLALLITGPGQMHTVPDFAMEFCRLPGFNTASTSRIPHNALADAEALRDYCERRDKP